MSRWLVLFLISIVLVGCQSTPSDDAEILAVSPENETQQIESSSDQIANSNDTSSATAEDPIILNLLALGNKALKRHNLLTPENDNANMYFQAVLGRDPNNKKAHQGLNNIVSQYTRWAIQKTKQRQYRAAKKYLDAAAFVNPNDANIAKAKKEIAKLRKKKKVEPQKIGRYGDKYYLPSNLLRLKEDVVLQHLQLIIDRIGQSRENIDIYWPNDRGARSLYKIINSHTDEFRVRGMIYLRKANYIEVKQKN